MSAPTANEIKAQIKTLLASWASTRKAKIIDYLALAFKPGELEDPSVLRSPTDTATLADMKTVVQRVNCLMISEESFTQAPAQLDATRMEARPGGRNLITRRFRLTYFYQFGQASENTFSTNIEGIRTVLNSNPKLGFTMLVAGKAGPGEYIHSHDKLQMPVMLPDAFGDTIVHVAEGILTVRVIEPLST